MTSVTDICNLALSTIGQDPINDIDEGSKNSNVCKLWYPSSRDAVLRAYPFTCSRKRTQIAADVGTPSFDFSYFHTVPNDFLRLLLINVDDDAWVKEGQQLLTNTTPIKIKYIRRIEDPNEFDALLVQALAARMAANISKPITGSIDEVEKLLQAYEILLREARLIDSQEASNKQELDADIWLRARA